MVRRLLALFVLLVASAARPVEAQDLAVIVNGARTDQPSMAEIKQIYLKQRRFWSDGGRIVAVNRESGSPPRAAFDGHVFGSRVGQLAVYWNRQYFQGVLPPATLASDEAVKRFVASEREAIGYVHPAVVDDSVRVVLQLTHP
jgi:ABC-type phosphate transport system substrate-binding protein